MQELVVKELNVKYTYGALAVSDLSFTADQGEITCIYGEAESGKTTLLKCLAGLIKPASGDIFYDGKSANGLKTNERDVVMIFEDGTFFEHKSVLYNLVYPLKIRKIEDRIIDETVACVLKKLDLDPSFSDKKVITLSQEERVDLSFARALMRKAGLILIDDPFKKLGADREEYFQKYSKIISDMAKDAVLIYATNNAKDCLYFDAHTVVLNYGICLQQGKPEEIKNSPNSLLSLTKFNDTCATFIGCIDRSGESIILKYNDNEVLLDNDKLISDIYIGKEVLIAEYGTDKKLILDKDNERIIYFS